jgi:outer membrane protein assembly factor BamB
MRGRAVRATLLAFALHTCTGLGCSVAARPTWWKARANLSNLAYAQADTLGGRLVWQQSFPGDTSCPVLWSPPLVRGATHDVNSSRIIVGTGFGITALLPLSGRSNGVGYDLVNTTNTCAAAPPARDPAPEPGSVSNRIYVASVAGEVYSFPPTFGSYFWKRNLGLGAVLTTSPTPDGPLLYLGASRYLFALKAADGSTEWQVALDSDVSPCSRQQSLSRPLQQWSSRRSTEAS